MTALAVFLACCAVAPVVTGSGALWRRSFLPGLLILDSPAGAEDIPAQYIIKFRSGKANLLVMQAGIPK
jgi:hypothetical protein